MNIVRRLYNDFFRPSKEADYEQILRTAREAGYEFHTVLSFEDVIAQGREAGKKYLILRRDIDTADFGILRKMLALEQQYGARCTYYFRWNTMNIALMHEIANAGGEASYHYEEIASYCYHHHIKTHDEMMPHLEDIRNLFISQYQSFKDMTKQPCLTVASHGDFVNIMVGCPNLVLMDDRVRQSCGIIREAYDAEHMDLLTCRIADQKEGDSFTGKALSALRRGEPVIELLTHPRQWNSPVWVNLKEEISRLYRGLYMKL